MQRSGLVGRRGLVLSLGLVGLALVGSSLSAMASLNAYYVGSKWGGYLRGATGLNRVKLNVFSQRGEIGIGIVLSDSAPILVEITENADGSVYIAGMGQYSGFTSAGMTPASGDGTYFNVGKFTKRAVPGNHDDAGSIGLVRLIPPDPYYPPDPFFPTGPSIGTFSSRTGFVGRMILEHNPPADHNPPSDHNPPDDITGKITFGDQTLLFTETRSNRPNADGSFNFDLIGMSPDLGSIIPCIRVAGRYTPATRTSPASIKGTYLREDSRKGILDQGNFDLVPGG